MRITGSLIIITIGVTLVSMSSAHPATSDSSWCDSSTPCERGTLCLGNKCLDMAVIASRYGPVTVEVNPECDFLHPCGQNMVCFQNECIDSNRIWASQIDNDDEDETARPISFDPITPPKTYTMRPPRVEHGSVQSGRSGK